MATATMKPAPPRPTLAALQAEYPDADCELDFTTPFQLLVATILSAQSTDKKVNEITPALFAAYPDAAALSEAEPGDVEQLIHATGFFRQKTKSIIGAAQMIVDDFDGEVPVELDDLVELPGVGRKTGHVVRGHAYGLPAITTDTHVIRVAGRLGWTATKKPEVVETELAALFLPEDWTSLSDCLIFHGRRCCDAKRPACGRCPVADVCPSVQAADEASNGK